MNAIFDGRTVCTGSSVHRSRGWTVLTLLGLLIGRTFPSVDAADPGLPAEFSETSHRYVGSASCSASNCHGGARHAEGPQYSAYLTWMQHDPHAGAYQVLFDDRSQRMVARLGDGWKAAHQEERCLACHSASPISQPDRLSPRFELSDGVSCEACHGPAEHWLRDHSRPGWSGLASPSKQEWGMRDTKNFIGRARVCAGCHIGDAGRDVNHELIAAGHPRLAFEFSAYLANYPPHWNVNDDHARALGVPHDSAIKPTQSTLDAQLWLVGQVVSVEAALKLTKSRAESSTAAWPELAEFSCFSCHHDLQADSWRQRGRGARGPTGSLTAWDRDPPGSLVWNSWLMAFASDLAASDDRWLPQLRTTRGLVRQPGGDRAAVARSAAEALAALQQSASIPRVSGLPELKALVDRATNASSPIDRHWEGAAQAYLAVCAATVALSGLPESESTGVNRATIREELESVRELLAFPQREQSPALHQVDRIQEVRIGFDRIRRLYALPVLDGGP